MYMTKTPFEQDLSVLMTEIETLLVAKNRKYGNSVLDPKRIFSKASSIEQILVRIDDKLSRLANQSAAEDEDAVLDLIGYLVILKIAQKNAASK